MNEALRELLVHLRGMWNRRFIGLAAAWIAGVVGVTIALIVPEYYAASARAYVDTQSMLRPVMAGLSIQPNLDQQVALISRTLLSRPNIEKLVQMAKLDDGVTSVHDRELLIEQVNKRIELTGNATSNIYFISYRDSNPQKALAVIESLLDIFVRSSVGDERQDARGALKFLDEQISHYEQSLQLAESRLKDFRLKYLGVPGQSGQAGQDYFGRMSRLTDEITNAKLELRAAIESRESYKRDLCRTDTDNAFDGTRRRPRRARPGNRRAHRVAEGQTRRTPAHLYRSASRCRGHAASHRRTGNTAAPGTAGARVGVREIRQARRTVREQPGVRKNSGCPCRMLKQRSPRFRDGSRLMKPNTRS